MVAAYLKLCVCVPRYMHPHTLRSLRHSAHSTHAPLCMQVVEAYLKPAVDHSEQPCKWARPDLYK